MDLFDAEIEKLANEVLGAAIEVHRHLRPGLPESVYRRAMRVELRLRGISIEEEKSVEVDYKGEDVGKGRLDLFVGGRLVVELKAVSAIADVHIQQTVGYLNLVKEPVGLVINVNVAVVKNGGIRRVIRSEFR
jgi:GxxExxY protein